jgi:hypothetical protein
MFSAHKSIYKLQKSVSKFKIHKLNFFYFNPVLNIFSYERSFNYIYGPSAFAQLLY